MQPFPSLDRKLQVSVAGGWFPRWGPDSRELFYQEGTACSRCACPASRSSAPARPSSFEKAGLGARPWPLGYDVAPDGRSFLALQRVEGSGVQTQLQLVVNWSEELERLAPPAKKR